MIFTGQIFVENIFKLQDLNVLKTNLIDGFERLGFDLIYTLVLNVDMGVERSFC